MSDLRTCPRNFLLDFIELYKSHPCLWKVKSPEYSNKPLKRAAYETLKWKLREVDRDSNRQTVVRKIDSLRGSFRKELKKVITSQRLGNDSEIYQPRLWYFEKLLFLVNPDREGPTTETSLKEFRLDQKFEIVNMEEYKSPPPSPTESSSPTIITLPNVQKRKTYEPLEVPTNKQPKVEDEFDMIGRNVAHKLRNFPKEIKIVAEKLVNDIFFECEIGNVNKYTRIKLCQMTPVSLNCTAKNEEIQIPT